MRHNQTLIAMLILIGANQIAVLSDALMKVAGQDANPFEILLYRQASTMLILLPFFLATSHKRIINPKIHLLRGHLWLCGALMMILSLTTLPLATANALFYTAPLMMLPLNYLLYRSGANRAQMMAAVLGFVGVLIIIRPGEFNWGALAALGCAFTLAVSNLTVRQIPKQEPVVTSLFWMNLLTLPATLALALPNMSGFNSELFWLSAGSSLFMLSLHAGSVLAYKMADANTIASTEYTGLIGAVLLGWWVFGERLDSLTLLGALLIVGPLVGLALLRLKSRPASRAQPQH